MNLLQDKICQLSVLGSYQGRLNATIGLGSTLSDLQSAYPDLAYDDDENYFHSPSLGSVAFFLQEPYTTDDPDNTIEEITLSEASSITY